METQKIVLENKQEIDVKKSVAVKWQKKEPVGYLLNYGGKVALMQIEQMNATLPQEQKIYSFSDFVRNAVHNHNQTHKDSVVFMSEIVNCDKDKYAESLKPPTPPPQAKTDTTTKVVEITVENVLEFCKIKKVATSGDKVNLITKLALNGTEQKQINEICEIYDNGLQIKKPTVLERVFNFN